MFTITRSLARQLRNMFRRGLLTGRSARRPVPVKFRADADGLRIQAINHAVGVEYFLPGNFPAAQFAMPIAPLAACESKRNDPVTLALVEDGRRVSLHWNDYGLPQTQLHHELTAEVLEVWPELPATFATNGRKLIDTLHTATCIAAPDSQRFATDALLLRGKGSKIMATDCRQALVCCGDFTLPWDDDVLMPGTDLFGFPEFPADANVEIGATASHVCVRIGPWTIVLKRVTDRRFPDVEGACPLRTAVKTTIQLAPADRTFLMEALPRLPAQGDMDSPVTVDCNGHLALRARGTDDPQATELTLSRSPVIGEPIRFSINRKYLFQALSLGFDNLQVVAPNAPIICDDGGRTYFWMTLGSEDALAQSKDCLRIDSLTGLPAPVPQGTVHSDSSSNHRTSTMRKSSNGQSNSRPENGSANGAITGAAAENGAANGSNVPDGNGSEGAAPETTDSLAAAEALQGSLREALVNTNRLIQVLRRNRKQARLVETTLASLRQLQPV